MENISPLDLLDNLRRWLHSTLLIDRRHQLSSNIEMNKSGAVVPVEVAAEGMWQPGRCYKHATGLEIVLDVIAGLRDCFVITSWQIDLDFARSGIVKNHPGTFGRGVQTVETHQLFAVSMHMIFHEAEIVMFLCPHGGEEC